MSRYSDLRDTTTGLYVSEAVSPAIPATPSPGRRTGLREWFQAWRENVAARRALAAMDARSLREIGVAPEFADYEMQRPFWRPVRDLRG